MSGSSARQRLSRWNPWQGLGTLPRGIWVLFATVLVNRMGTMVLPFLTLYLTEHLGFDPGRAGLVLTFYGLGSIVAAPLAGRMADRVGSVLLMRLSLAATAGVLFVFPQATGWAAVLACAVLLAVVSEAYRPASMSLVTDLVPAEQRKAAYSVSRLAINLGMSVGPAVGGFLVERSFDALFWVDGGTSLAAAAVLLLFPVGAAAAIRRAPAPSAAGVPSRGRTSRPPFRDGRYLVFLAATILVSAVFFQHTGAMAIHVVRDLGFAPSFFGILFTINTVLIVVLEVRLNFATSHWTHARALFLGALLLGVGFGGLAFARQAWSIAATVAVWTFGEMMLLPAMSNFVAEIAPADRRGEYMGFYTMAWGVAFSAGPWAGTEILHRFGPIVMWTGCFVVALAGGWIMTRTDPRPRHGAAGLPDGSGA